MNATGADLSILVPLLGRANRIERLLASARRATPEAEVWLIASHDDGPVRDFLTERQTFVPGAAGFDVVRHFDDPLVRVAFMYWPGGSPGDYAQKINAIAGIIERDWLFTGAIDLCFCLNWYAEAARVQHATGALVIGTNDLCNPRTSGSYAGTDHSTHSLFSTAYVREQGTADRPGHVYHEGYVHEFVDDEAVRTARHRAVYAHAGRAHVEHLHPTCGKEQSDAVYRQQGRRIALGRQEFDRRKHLWGGAE